MTDMTELLEAHTTRDRAEHESRIKDEFLALLGHELRNPLGAIGAAAQVLKVTHAKGKPEARAHDVIARQVDYITRLIDDLLDIERVNSGKIRLTRQPFDLAEVVLRAAATFTADTRLDRHIDVTTEPAWVDGDAVGFSRCSPTSSPTPSSTRHPVAGFAWPCAATAQTRC